MENVYHTKELTPGIEQKMELVFFVMSLQCYLQILVFQNMTKIDKTYQIFNFRTFQSKFSLTIYSEFYVDKGGFLAGTILKHYFLQL